MVRNSGEGMSRTPSPRRCPLGLAPPTFRASFLDSGKELRGGNTKGVTDAKKNVHGWRFLVVFQLTYVGTVQPSLEGQLLLGQFRCFSGFSKFIS